MILRLIGRSFPILTCPLVFLFAVGPAIGQDCGSQDLPMRQYQVGNTPAWVLAEDVNGDSYADLVVANEGSNSISVLLNNGDGTYADQFGFFSGLGPADPTLADLDGDGDLDLVVLNQQSRQVSVYENPGDGRFTSRDAYELLENFGTDDLFSITVDDFDADGDLDIMAPIPDNRTLTTLWNHGDGTFAVEYDYEPLDVGYVQYVEWVDVDLDGDKDWIVAGGSASFGVFLNIGDGAYEFDDSYPVNDGTGEVELADLNSDGYIDVVIPDEPDSFNRFFRVYLNDGAGGFDDRESYESSDYIGDLELADIDLDGNIDIVAVSSLFGNSEISVHFNMGDGTFADPLVLVESVASLGLAIADADGDTDPDLFYTGGVVGVIMNRGDGTFLLPEQFESTYPVGGFDLIDVDSDGDDDLVSVDDSTGEITVSESSSRGTFADPLRYAAGTEPRLALHGDVDTDGDPDLIVKNSGSTYSTLLNNGDGTFALPVAFDIDELFVVQQLTDFDGDGTPDIVAHNLGSQIRVYLGDGSGLFGSPIEIQAGSEIVSVSVGDIDLDGDRDLAVLDEVDSAWDLLVVSNAGDGMFVPGERYRVGIFPQIGELHDLDLDGDLDYVSVNFGSDDVSVAMNTGNGSFAKPVRYYVSDAPEKMIVVDYDADGDLDLVTQVSFGFRFVVLLNDGLGGFDHRARYTGIGFDEPDLLTLGDVDGDAYPDMMYRSDGKFTLYRSRCSTEQPCPADLNGDGDLNFFDVSAFLTAYGASEPIADFNGDGQFNFFDVTAFIVAFNAGCP